MYDLFRKIHLYTGLTLVLFIATYVVSGYLIVHNDWWPNQQLPEITTQHNLTVAGTPAVPPNQTLVQGVAKQYQVRGRPGQSQVLPKGLEVQFNRPGEQARALVSSDGSHLTINRRPARFIDALRALHHLHGYSGGWPYLLWALVCDLASVAMIVFVLSGIYMWWKLKRNHVLGYSLLIISQGYALAVIFYLLYAR